LSALTLSSASKVAEYPGRKNAFSLPAGKTCPFATPTCAAGCYAKKGRFRFTPVTEAYAQNLSALRRAATAPNMAKLLIDAMGGHTFKKFRIHVSGDFYSPTYTDAWRMACAKFPDREFWAYTRSTDTRVLDILASIPNMSMNLSCDRDNWMEMLALAPRYPAFKLCYYSLGEKPDDKLYDHDPELVVFVDHSVRGSKLFRGNCPAELGHRGGIPIEGACIKCQRCLVPRSQELIDQKVA
jgi:hypothetical protein